MIELTYYLLDEEEGDSDRTLTLTVPSSYEAWATEFMESANLVLAFRSEVL